jgi:hypothetical protein
MSHVEFRHLGEPKAVVSDPLGASYQVRLAQICDEVLPGDEP